MLHPHLLPLYTTAQSIIEEEGGGTGLSAKSNGTAGSAGTEDGNGNGEPNNWDQPLIVAEPDVKVRESDCDLCIYVHYAYFAIVFLFYFICEHYLFIVVLTA